VNSCLYLNRLEKMTDKTYLVRFKPRGIGLQTVIAARAEIDGEHIALLDSEGKLAALFLMEIVESWSVLGAGGMTPGAVAHFPRA
jgi:hypothetical protein